MKSNKKRIIIVFAILTMALVLSCALVACDKKDTGDKPNSNDLGVYYEVVGSSLDEKSYIELKSGNVWYDGEDQGTFKINGGNITLYDGDLELMSGTISNGVLTLSFMGETTVYKKSGSMGSGNVDQKAMIKSIQNGKVDGLTVSLEIDNTVEDVDLSGMITTSKDCSWQLYTSRTATSADAIVTKIIVPKNGNNTYYIVVTSADGKTNRTYTLNVWKNYYVTLLFYANGTFYTSEQVLTHTTYGSGPSCSVAGYTFNGWGCDGYYVTESKSFNANLTPLTYSAKFDSNGGSTVSNKTATFNKDLSLPTPYRTGYSFLGWYLNGNLYKDSIKYTYTNDVTFTARWQINSYNVKIVSDDETCGTVNSFDGEKQYKSSVNLIATTKTEIVNSKCTLVFVGWFENDVFLSNNLTYTATTPSNDIVYTAKWAKLTISSNNSQAGDISGLKTINKVGDSLTITASINLGYEFLGWYDGYKMVSDKATFTFAMPNTTKALVAKYKVADEMENFVFSSDQTSCIINGIKNKNITGIVVPNYVTRIGNSSFSGCSKLTSVTIGSGVTNIGSSVFDNCTELTSIVVVDGNTIYHSNGNCLIVTKNETLILGCKNSIIPSDGSVTSISERAFYNCTGLTSITIPDSVTSIGKYAFNGCTGLTSVTINGTVTKIDNYVFYNCRSLTTITIPDSVTSIGERAFSGCTGLTSITIPDHVTNIGKYAFNGCTGLTSVTIGNSVTSIGENAFAYCTGLTSITIPDGVTSIGGSAFSVCNGLTKISGSATNVCTVAKQANPSSFVVYITSGDSIDEKAFYYDTGLTGVTIGNSVTSIGESAFYGCKGLTSITIPDSVTSIGNYAFYGCSSLESITIPFVGKSTTTTNGYEQVFGYIFGYVRTNNSSNVVNGATLRVYFDGYYYWYYIPSSLKSIVIGSTATTIPSHAFYYCKNITEITIPESVTSIGDYAFYNCTGLTSITIPNSVTSIGSSAFSSCSALASIVVSENNSAFSGDHGILYDKNKTQIIYVPRAIQGAITVPDSVTSIGESVFASCSGLTSVTIGGNVTSIGRYAFSGCSGLTSVTIPESVTSIDDYAFYNCTGLTSITIPDSVTSIGDSALRDCTGLTSISGSATNVSTVARQARPTSFSVNITSGTSIGGDAFRNCTGLTSITIPDSVTYIGNNAFYGCTGLTSITIPDSVTSIGERAFAGCTGLTSISGSATNVSTVAMQARPTSFTVNITSGTSIGESAFYGCKGLTSITIPDSVTSIGGGAFGGCTGLTSIYYTGNIAEWCGISGTGLGSLMSSSLTLYIDGNKVEGELIIPESVTSIGSSAFSYCTGLTSVTIPDSVTSIGSSAFSYCTGLTSITIPESVTSIGDYAFYNCTGLTSITIPDSVTSIGRSAFSSCTGLTSITVAKGNTKYHSSGNCLIKTASKTLILGCKTSVIPSDGSVTSIGESAFYGCTGLTSVTIPRSVTSIGWGAFSGCTWLTSVTIPDSVTSIAGSAFRDCTGLTSVTIGNSVTSIGSNAFYGCYSLIEVYNKSTLSITAGSSSNGYVAYYAKNVYKNEGGSKLTTDENGYVIYTDGDEKILVAYRGTNTELILPSYITKINQYAFYNCSRLTSVTIPDSVTSIGDYAFSGCSGLTSVTIGNSVTSIGDYAFYNCTSLTSVTIPDSVTSIGYDAFYCCKGLTTVNWNATKCTRAGSHDSPIFKGCSNLATVNIGDNVTTIPSYAFSGCSGLTSVTIGNGVTSIGRYAFDGCTGLTSITFNGTKAQWNAISKGNNWERSVPSTCKVVCTDGTVSI